MKGVGRPVLFLGSALLVACGGGGGGGAFTPLPDLAITADNAIEVTSAVVVATTLAFEYGGATGGELGTAATAGTLDRLRAQALGSAALRVRALADAGTVRPAVAFGPETQACGVSGSVTLSGNIANPPDVSVGDRISARFDDCDEGEDVVFDGRLDLVIRDLEGDLTTDVFLFEVDLDLDDLVLIIEGQSARANGEFTLIFDSLDYPFTITSLVGNVLDIVAEGEQVRLDDFDLRLDEDFGDDPVPRTTIASGTLSSSPLGGKVAFLTESGQPVFGLGDAAPTSGFLRITGASGSRVRALIGVGAVQLEVDSNGDGTIETVIDTTWEELSDLD